VTDCVWYLIHAGDCCRLAYPKYSMRKRLLFIILATCAVFGHTVSLLAFESGLFTGEAAVADQSAAEQSRAKPQALLQVLQKVSGLRNFEAYPDLGSAIRNAAALAVTTYYSDREFSLPDGEKRQQSFLVVEFSSAAVMELAKSLQLPIWKPERRPLTVWFVVDDGGTRTIMPIELEYAWDGVAAIADARGMPIVRPQPDESGVYAVDPQLLWGGYTEELVESGPADALVIAARREGQDWNVRMNMDYTGEVRSWRNRNPDIQLALAEGMQMAIDEIVALNSIAASDQGQQTTQVSVTGLATAKDYARCLNYLQSLSLVERVEVLAAAPGKASFSLTLNALPQYLFSALVADGVLAATANSDEYSLLP